MWTYLLAGLAVLAGWCLNTIVFFLIFFPGLLLLYTLCLKAAENDWTVGERTPPGPLHLPLIGDSDGRYDEDLDEDGMCSNDQ